MNKCPFYKLIVSKAIQISPVSSPFFSPEAVEIEQKDHSYVVFPEI